MADPRHSSMYTIAESARLLGVRTSTLSRWMYGSNSKGRTARPVVDVGEVLSFQDFAELSVVASLKHLGFSLARVRHAADCIREKMGVERPFLQGVLVDEKVREIFWQEYEGTDQEMTWSATRGGQLIIPEAVQTRMIPPRVNINRDGIATRVLPYSRPSEPKEDRTLVALDPTIRFGRPITNPSLIDIEGIAGRFTWGESIEALADEMKPEQGKLEIEEGLRYYVLTLTEGQLRRLEGTPSPAPQLFRQGKSVLQIAAERSTDPDVVQEEIREGLDRVLAA